MQIYKRTYILNTPACKNAWSVKCNFSNNADPTVYVKQRRILISCELCVTWVCYAVLETEAGFSARHDTHAAPKYIYIYLLIR